MHEFSMAQNILQIVLAEAEKRQANGVRAIYLKLGETSHIEPDSLVFCLKLAAKGTLAEGVKVHIERVKEGDLLLKAIEVE